MMQFSDNEATQLTEQIMGELYNSVPGKTPSTEKYNAAYSAVHALLTELLELEQNPTKASDHRPGGRGE